MLSYNTGMKVNNFTLSEDIKTELAKRFKTYRLSLNLSQEYISNKSGVSLGTIKSFEKSGTISLDNLIKVLRVLNLLDSIDSLIPDLGLNTIDVHNLGHEKQRVSRKKNKEIAKWGDE